ncbi:Pyrroline-5-carboxylate reductase [Schistosoma japonicum]|uniref:pyrroline-5-carboxylate reductase n=2 Tax=Schistosoma japonicum TaxID=6182 RepID=Q86ER8_SCHJA|nr:SJCHGC02207 protein [Schistosoma japonicum]KAH8850663.1 Pyrroline-5-carboxylate reductase [Schistosoma japonicum]
MLLNSWYIVRKSSLFENILYTKRYGMSTDVKTILASKHYGFLGSGNMSQALVKGFLSSNTINSSQVTMTDRFGLSFPDAELQISLKSLCSKYGVEYLQANEPMVEKSDIIFACVKPHILLPVLKGLWNRLDNKLLISIAAGITLDQIQKAVPTSTRIIRIMPNTPCQVGVGTAVYAHTSTVTEHDIQLISALCSSIFPVFEAIPESLFNAAVAMSGSSPAFIYMVAEAITDAGVLLGLPRATAQKLIVNTILGSAVMMQKSDKNTTELKNNVCSPGGTTIHGVYALEKGNLRATLMDAVQKVCARGEELSKNS